MNAALDGLLGITERPLKWAIEAAVYETYRPDAPVWWRGRWVRERHEILARRFPNLYPSVKAEPALF